MDAKESSEQRRQENVKQGSNEDNSEYNDVYSKIKKADIVQEAKCFGDKQIREAKCSDLLAKIIYLANHVNLICFKFAKGRNVY